MENKETKTVTSPAVTSEGKSAETSAVPAAETEVKAPAKRGPKTDKAQKAAAKKNTGAKKAPAARKNAAAKTASVSGKVADDVVKTVVQFSGKEVDTGAVREKILNKFVAEGHRAGAIKQMEIYIVTEENKAYYVINGGKFDGNVDLF